MALVLCNMIAFSNVACGNENAEITAPVQESEDTSSEETMQENVTQEVTAEEAAAQTEESIVAEDSAEEDNAKQEENKTSGLTIGSSELEEICAKYDKVLSTYDVEVYFGYNIPDNWRGDDSWDSDGRQQSRYIDIWRNGEETITIQGFEGGNRYMGTYVTDDDGNQFIPPSDMYEYKNRYNDALHEFCKTGEWKEPERPKSPVGQPDSENGSVGFCPTRIYRGDIDTPYGKGTLCSTVYETVIYTGYDAETHCWTKVDHTESWNRTEEMILEIDDWIVTIKYDNFNWYMLDAEPTDLEYMGLLDEIIPQMF